jgi:hypothetical protein
MRLELFFDFVTTHFRLHANEYELPNFYKLSVSTSIFDRMCKWTSDLAVSSFSIFFFLCSENSALPLDDAAHSNLTNANLNGSISTDIGLLTGLTFLCESLRLPCLVVD